MTTYQNRIEMVISELEDIKSTMPIFEYSFEYETAIRALKTILE